MPKANARGLGAKSDHIYWYQFIGRYFLTHLDAIKLSLNNLMRTPIATSMTVAAIGVCLALPMSLYLFVSNLQHLSQDWEQGATMSVYVKPGSPTQISPLLSKIRQYPFVTQTHYLTPEMALKEFQKTAGFQDMLALLPENPLPGVISVELDLKHATKPELSLMKDNLSLNAQVIKVDFDLQWMEKLNLFLSFGKRLINFLYLIIGIGVILIVANTIRLTLERHKDEIEVLNLIGATKAYIRRPFLYRGTLYGALGGSIALVVVNIAVFSFKIPAAEINSLFNGVFSLESLSFSDTAILFLASTGLGFLGALIAFTQQNHLYYYEKI